MNAQLANRLWLFTSRRAARDFHQAAHHVEETQSQLLQNYLARNRDTLYLRTHVDTYIGKQGNYQLPLTTYDDYLPYLERIADGEPNILTRDPVQLFELSSGSTAASKMIPYTRTLKAEFGRGLAAWITDLFTHHADLAAGPAYWSVSPLTEGRRQTRGGIPIGFEEDSAYLGPLGSLIESALAVPNLVKHIRDVDSFRYVTLLFLLRCENLRLISVWNPTFLTLLLAPLPDWWDSLLKDIAEGTLTPPAPIDTTIHSALLKKLRRNMPKVHRYTGTQVNNGTRNLALSEVEGTQHATRLFQISPTDYVSIWPRLKLISCWSDGASEPYARDLAEKFPNVTLQPKGLLATEAFVSFPLAGYEGGALAVASHYFEFLADSGDIFLAHQLEKGKTYSVVVTTGGGLYRYQLNDLIEVTDFYGQIPCFKFIGKADRVSDYFGEKLNEQFVANILTQLFEKHRLAPLFSMLAPDDTPPFHYTLYLELPNYETTQLRNYLTTELDLSLRANFHYDYCRKLGQLGEAQVSLVTRGAETYIQACQSRGQKLGDIKPSVLHKSTGWDAWFGNDEISQTPKG